MLLHILSDLHVEFETFEPPQVDCDVVVLAGDIHVGNKGLRWAIEKFPHVPVIYVLGNHEYYGKALPKLTETLKQEARDSNVHILENDKLVVDDVVFLGCTLWTDFKLFGDPRISGYEATQKMTDYRKIRVSPQYRKLRSIDTTVIHSKSVHWLKTQFPDQMDRKIIIVTHHAPSEKSLPRPYQNDILSAAYASRLDDVIEASMAKLWIHGHIHTTQDYSIGTTRIVCNPKGYPDQYNSQFNPGCVIEV